MKSSRKKLVLFDIDGTLTTRVGDLKKSLWRFPYVVKKLFNVTLDLTVDDYMSFNGWIDKAQVWEMVKSKGIKRKEYLQKFPLFGKYGLEYMNLYDPKYKSVRGAKELLTKLSSNNDITLGIITGNVQVIAWWKLEQVGLRKFFSFGLFGEEADNRIELAKRVFQKTNFSPEEITIIGDTIHDVTCAKAIGAHAILVLTGGVNSKVPTDIKPDLVVTSLKDARVLQSIHATPGSSIRHL